MTPESLDLFQAVISVDALAVQRALAAGADVNATDAKGRNVAAYAALGNAIDALHMPIQPQLSEPRLEILQLVLEHPDLSLYSLNAPLAWAGGVTLLGLMSWLNMPTEIMCLLEFTQGLVEVNAMDEQGATPLMYAARDGSLPVVQRLLAHNARPDLRDASQRSAIQHALPHPQVLWLCEDALRRERSRDSEPLSPTSPSPFTPLPSKPDGLVNLLFVSTPMDTIPAPPPLTYFDTIELRRTFDALVCAVRAGGLDTLHALLFPRRPAGPLENYSPTSTTSPVPPLVNFRDTSGLTLVHHAVSQRPNPSIAVLDALYRGGADVGLFSTLGFTPLHHLARTARDNVKPVTRECGHSRPSPAAYTHPLYMFTTHLLWDLYAPLGATDSKGETPLHAAAEHGHSVYVLQAMLDRDAKFPGEGSVREARNDRGLRPVDVAKQEFLPLFVSEEPIQAHPRSQVQPLDRDPAPRPNLVQSASRPGSSRNGRPPTSAWLAKKDSNTSLTSRSSGSSSASSSVQSPGSYLSNTSHTSYQSHQPPKQAIPVRMLLTPDPAPHVLDPPLPDTQDPIDVPACALDAISNLSFCAAALHAYAHPNLHENDFASLPDVNILSDTLLYTHDLALHVLEHWMGRLEAARGEFERLKWELERAVGIHERVENEVEKLMGTVEEPRGGVEGKTPRRGKQRDTTKVKEAVVKHTGVQTDLENRGAFNAPRQVTSLPVGVDVHLSNKSSHCVVANLATPVGLEGTAKPVSVYAFKEKERLREATSENSSSFKAQAKEREREGTMNADMKQQAVLTGFVKSAYKERPLGLEIVKELEDGRGCMIGREVKMPRPRFVSEGLLDEPSGTDVHSPKTLDSLEDLLRSAPRILQRARRDLDGVVAQIAQVHYSFTHAQQSVAQARMLLEEALKSREDKLDALIQVRRPPDISSPSSRLPPIPERTSDTASSTTTSPSPFFNQLPSPSSPSKPDARYIMAMAPIEEPHALRRLLTRKLAQYVERVFNDLQKAHVWLRIIREVLRGLRRRVLEH